MQPDYRRIDGHIALCPVCMRAMPWGEKDVVPAPSTTDWCEDCCCAVMALVSEEEQEHPLALEFKSTFSRSQLDIIAVRASIGDGLHGPVSK